MQSPNPNSSKNSTTSPKKTNPPSKSSKRSMEEDALKTALEVLEELKMVKNEIGRGDSKVVAANSSMVEVMGGDAVNDGRSIKKGMKNIEVEDIYPSKYPICPKCNGEFFTLSATIEHLVKNPNCVPSSTSNPPQLDLNKGANEVQPMEIEGSSNAAAAAEPEPAERRGYGFDLNELPPPDEDEMPLVGADEVKPLEIEGSSNVAAAPPKPAEGFVGPKKRATRDHVAKITLSDLVKYFHMPLLEASKKLDVGITVLKKKCREFGLPRWPHRKIKSLDSLIRDLHQQEAKHKEMENKAAARAVRRKQKMVESEKERIAKKPLIAIQIETKKLRQHVFKKRHSARVMMEKQNSTKASN